MFRERTWAFQTCAVYLCLVFFSWSAEHKTASASDRRRSDGFHEFRKPPRRGGKSSSSGPRSAYQKISRVKDGYAVEFGFKNFNGDRLSVRAHLDASVVADSIKEFGFRRADFDELDAWYKNARRLAIDQTNKFLAARKFKTQAEANRASAEAQRSLDRELDLVAKAYRKRRLKVYEKAGFHMKGQGVVEADIPGMVRRNWKRMRPLAREFNAIADERGYEAEDLVGAVTAMVQTSMRYEIPDKQEGTRTIGGLLPPLKAVVLGQGDCDTKTAVIASVLANWPNVKMVGLGIPGHYLMAYHAIPRRGDVFIEYKGLQYIMIESAGPAWLRPGTVGDTTLAYLQAGNNFRIQPM